MKFTFLNIATQWVHVSTTRRDIYCHIVSLSWFLRPKWITSTKRKFAVRKHFAWTADTSEKVVVSLLLLFWLNIENLEFPTPWRAKSQFASSSHGRRTRVEIGQLLLSCRLFVAAVLIERWKPRVPYEKIYIVSFDWLRTEPNISHDHLLILRPRPHECVWKVCVFISLKTQWKYCVQTIVFRSFYPSTRKRWKRLKTLSTFYCVCQKALFKFMPHKH